MDDLISRQAAIDVLAVGEALLRCLLDDMDVVGCEREKYEWGLGLIESYILDMKGLQSAKPEVTEEDVKEYCRDRCLCIVDSALLKKYEAFNAARRALL